MSYVFGSLKLPKYNNKYYNEWNIEWGIRLTVQLGYVIRVPASRNRDYAIIKNPPPGGT